MHALLASYQNQIDIEGMAVSSAWSTPMTGATATARYQIGPEFEVGTRLASFANPEITKTHKWIRPGSSPFADSYEVLATMVEPPTGGTFFGTMDTWLPFITTASYIWQLTSPANSEAECTINIKVRRRGSNLILDEGFVLLYALINT